MPISGVSNSDLLDLQRTTTENLPNLEFEVALNYQSYLVVDKWFQSDKVQLDSGTSIKRNIILDDSGNAIHVRLYQKVPVNQSNVQRNITAPWVQARTHYTTERREILRNRAPSKFVDYLKTKRVDGMVSLANLIENDGWKSPENSADDLNPRGLPYWLNKSINTSDSGYIAAHDLAGTFCGRRVIYNDKSTSTTDVAGINPTNELKWRNYADVYTSATQADLLNKMRRAFFATSFQAPMMVKDLEKGPKANYRIYTDLTTIVSLEELVQSQNATGGIGSDTLGPDLAKFHGVTAFRRVPMEYAPLLDLDTDGTASASTNPVYMVNHNVFYPFTQEGDWLRENEPMADVESNNVFVTIVDNSYQFFCKNRRTAGAVIHKAVRTVFP